MVLVRELASSEEDFAPYLRAVPLGVGSEQPFRGRVVGRHGRLQASQAVLFGNPPGERVEKRAGDTQPPQDSSTAICQISSVRGASGRR